MCKKCEIYRSKVNARSRSKLETFVCHLCYNFVCQPLITGRVHGALSSPYTPGDQDPHGL